MPDIQLIFNGQYFPRYRYKRRETADLLDEAASLERIDNIPDAALERFRVRYADATITKDDIFDYVYGVLHAPDYRARFAGNFAKELARVPFAPDFRAFADAGKALAGLHLGYETGPEYPLAVEGAGEAARLFDTSYMKWADKQEKSALKVNARLTLSGIPAEAHRYEVNGRTPLGWFIDRYRDYVKDGIRNDANAWFADEAAFIAAVKRVVHLSVETVRIVEALPKALEEVAD